MIDQVYHIQDCIEGCRQRIKDRSVKFVFADPPFNIRYGSTSAAYRSEMAKRKEIYYEDAMTPDEYEKFCRSWIGEGYRILEDDGIMVIMSSWNFVSMIERISNEFIGFVTINHVIWRYEFGMFTTHKFSTSHYHYLILLKGDPNKRGWTFNKQKKQQEDVERETKLFLDEIDPEERERNVLLVAKKIEELIYEKRGQYAADDFFDDLHRLSDRYSGVGHPCKLSEDVLAKFFAIFSNEGDLVVDLFMGSGTSFVAAAMTRRKYIGFEINKDYEPEIRKLIKNRMTAKKNVKKVDEL
jgi:site-specific DNA-methyltransferase (adenine-specific)